MQANWQLWFIHSGCPTLWFNSALIEEQHSQTWEALRCHGCKGEWHVACFSLSSCSLWRRCLDAFWWQWAVNQPERQTSLKWEVPPGIASRKESGARLCKAYKIYIHNPMKNTWQCSLEQTDFLQHWSFSNGLGVWRGWYADHWKGPLRIILWAKYAVAFRIIWSQWPSLGHTFYLFLHIES